MAVFAGELRVAVRSLLRAPTYTAVTVLTLALGIGANALMFSVLSTLVLRPLPFPNASRLYLLPNTHASPAGVREDYAAGPLEYLRWKANARTLQRVEALSPRSFTLGAPGRTERVEGNEATAGLFAAHGVAPVLGRVYTAEEDDARARLAVVSHEFWRTRLGADRAALGRTLLLDGESYEVIGVMPAGFRAGLKPGDVWVPIGLREDRIENAGTRRLMVLGVGRPGDASRITADIESVSRELAREFPASHEGWSGHAVPLREALGKDDKPAATGLSLAVGFLLLLACANVANLALARAVRRHGEAVLRVTLGATGWRLVRLQLLESGLVAAAASVLGLLIAAVALPFVLSRNPTGSALVSTANVDVRVLGFAVLASVLVAVLCALAPAVLALRTRAASALAEGSRRTAGGRSGAGVRRALMGTQVALATVLLAGAMSAIRTLGELGHRDLGFQPAHLASVQVTLSSDRYAAKAAKIAYVDRVLVRVRAVPGVVSASVTTSPFQRDASMRTMVAEEGRDVTDADRVAVELRRVSPDYFQTMRTRLVRGRVIDAGDRESSTPVAVISRKMASTLWPGEDPIGRRLHRGPASAPWLTVVGVVDDVMERGAGGDVDPTLYLPFAQTATAVVNVVARTRGNPALALPALRRAVQSADAALALEKSTTLDQLLRDTLEPERFRALLLTAFAALGLLLAALGIYGVTAYLVAERTREVGVRMALGARPTGVAGLVVAGAGRVVLLGVVAGVAGDLALGAVSSGLVSRLLRADPGSLALVTATIVAIAIVAALVPAVRASRLSPAAALRAE